MTSSSFIKRAPVRVNPVTSHPRERRLSLDGEWRFRLDPSDSGVEEEWFDADAAFDQVIAVPGCWQGQGFGGEGEDRVWDFGLDARTYRATYAGTGWYKRHFTVPESWRGNRIWINFGGVHPSAEIWVNGSCVGSHSAPYVPFAYEITGICGFEGGNSVTVRVHEKDRFLGLAYNWQGNWSGLYRSVELSCTGPAWIGDIVLRPDLDSGILGVEAPLEGDLAPDAVLEIFILSPSGEAVAATEIEWDGRKRRIEVQVQDPVPWSPDTPTLYAALLQLRSGGSVLDAAAVRFGFVEISTNGRKVLINGDPYYMRGTGDFAISPETGSPDTDRTRWRTKLATLRHYGYNYVRCQSYAPTPEYLDAADEVGILVQSEMGALGAWAGASVWHTYAWPRPTPLYIDRLLKQWELTVTRDANHPSATIYCMSNELGSGTEFPRTAWRCYRMTKEIKPTSLVLWTDGGYNPDLPGDIVNADASVLAETEKPVIQHEFRWWSSYPDTRIKHKYSGRAVRPYAIEMAEKKARENGLEPTLPLIAANSQRLQYLEARTNIEACRRDNPDLAGICHFTAMDIGFTPQGILDEFYERKRATPEEWLRCWGDTVLMIDRDFDDRVLAPGDELSCRILVSDFSHPHLAEPVLTWEVELEGSIVSSHGSRFEHRPYTTTGAGDLRVSLPEVSRPSKATLRAEVGDGVRSFRNQWSFWLMPQEGEADLDVFVYGPTAGSWLETLGGVEEIAPSRISSGLGPKTIISSVLDDELIRYMERGGRVILAAGEGLTRPFPSKLGLKKGRYFFLPPANYPPFSDGNSGTIISDHPLLGDFPHEGWADLHLYRPISESPPLDLRGLGLPDSDTIVRAISTYFVSLPLAYIVEYKVGNGGLVITSLDLNQDWPESRYLLARFLDYTTGESFGPDQQIDRGIITRIASITSALAGIDGIHDRPGAGNET